MTANVRYCCGCLQPMTNCIPEVMPTETSSQFFYETPATKDCCFCLESTSSQGNFVYVEDEQVFLKKTTTDNVQTHFSFTPYSASSEGFASLDLQAGNSQKGSLIMTEREKQSRKIQDKMSVPKNIGPNVRVSKYRTGKRRIRKHRTEKRKTGKRRVIFYYILIIFLYLLL